MSEEKRQTVAVVVVHGVGDQQPFETVRRIGDILQDLDRDRTLAQSLEVEPPCRDGGNGRAAPENPRYYPFREEKIRINVRPVVVAGDDNEQEDRVAPAGQIHGPFYSMVQRLGGSSLSADEVWWRFTRGQLECYTGDDAENTYETLRLEGERVDNAGDQKDVHLYELYWADLSRLRAGIFSIFMELYQLLFHLSSLGVHTVSAAAAVNKSDAWKWLLKLQAAASFLLTVPILILNLLMLAIALVVVGLDGASRLGWRAQLLAVAAVVLTGLLAALGRFIWRKGEINLSRWSGPLAAWALAIVATAIGVYAVALDQPPDWLLKAVETVILATLAGGLMWLILAAYERRRAGALRWAGRFVLAVLIFGDVSLLWSRVDNAVALMTRQFEAALWVLSGCWLAFFACTAILFFARLTARKTPEGSRSTWTGVLMLVLPAAAFILTSILLWVLVGEFLRTFLQPWTYETMWGHRPVVVPVLVLYVLETHVFTIFCAAVVAFGLAAIPAVWGLTPSAWAEVFPPDARKSVNATYSNTLGGWLNTTFRGLLTSGFLLWFMVAIVMPCVMVIPTLQNWIAGKYLVAIGSVGATVFGAVFAARGTLQKVALGFHPVLDILLDVDNWMRESPRESNPKARILGRYVSLLRYILNWRNPTDPTAGYQKIVIISHSQGTVITADLLRFLQRSATLAGGWASYDAQLAPLGGMGITLFTMGSPLRQLYNLRFPYLYRWAGFPNPAELARVETWWNAYRSGDYVGRYLWTPDVWTPVNVLPAAPATFPPGSGEFCIGAGAHTHYWDRTAPAIAWQLDLLI